MKPLTISDAETMILILQDEIRRSSEARYDHRLHGVLLVAQGMSCPEVAKTLGDAPRTVEYWVRQFEAEGLSGLAEADRPGRPCRLDAGNLAEIESALRKSPRNFGLEANLWDGKALAKFIENRFGVTLCVRQCQRLFRRFKFRLRKPRPALSRADPERQEVCKKNSKR